jgi:hypothetical protein
MNSQERENIIVYLSKFKNINEDSYIYMNDQELENIYTFIYHAKENFE